MPRTITNSWSMTGVAVREFGKVSRPNSSIMECFQSSLPSGENAMSKPCVCWA